MEIPWGKAGIGASLTEQNIKQLKKRLIKHGKKDNLLSLSVLPKEYHWIRKNVTNAYVHKIITLDNGKIWIVMGTDVATVRNYVNKI